MPFWMWWRNPLADELRRYLQQQMELGGAEVVLSAGQRVSGSIGQWDSGTAGQADSQTGGQEAAAVRPLKRAEIVAPSPTGEPRWRKGAPPIPGPGLAVESPSHALGDELLALKTLDEVAERIRTTHCCGLCPNRIKAVPGDGNPAARLVLVGEGPGANEDVQGIPFVGQAGNLLNGILEAIEVPRESVYITNVVKCRPPQNRKPLPDEITACIPYLHRQLEIIQPKVILTLGSTAAEAMLGVRKSLGELRNKVHTYNGIPLVVTYHPAALLRNPNWKKPTWDDVRIVRQLLDR
ncbi:MAG: uracil-DNA glycosylase [Gemmatimonadales bacterium]|nr:uracil-DNA glycosylase [Gemmatimonadales bacterium]